MDEFDESLERASHSLAQFVDGPGMQAANTLEQAFSGAAKNIEQALTQAAQSGEFDFQSMTRSILADLAQIVAEALIAQSGLSQVGQTFNLSMSVNDATQSRSGLGVAGSVATLVAAAAARGARFA